MLKKMSNRKALLKGLAEVRDDVSGVAPLTAEYIEPPRVNVTQIRASTGLSREEFARTFGLKPGTLRNWEQGVREPEGAARIYLSLIAAEPVKIASRVKDLLTPSARL